MLFNSFNFLIFFPIVLLTYFAIPAKVRYIWVLICSYYFYASWDFIFIFLLFFITLITYFAALGVEIYKKAETKNLLLVLAISICFLLLLWFKYINFAIENVNHFLEIIGASKVMPYFDIILPVGVSFYTFQAVGYVIDVYRGKISAEKNILRYGLFISFFPQLVAGPIERSGNLLNQLRNIHTINIYNWENVIHGFRLMIWGYFEKLLIADRAAILVDTVYNSYYSYGFWEIATATILFALQIYCDFDGYTNIARGVAKIMGMDLMPNFGQPYLAQNIVDFWKRWHLSLTTWFTDYLYIPLGGSRKGKLRNYVNIFIVFLVSGLWHGASWHYVVWGGLHAIYQIVYKIWRSIRVSLSLPHNLVNFKVINCIFTFVIVDFAWLFFRAGSMDDAMEMIKCMGDFVPKVSVYNLGLSSYDWTILLWSILVLFIVDYHRAKGIRLMKDREGGFVCALAVLAIVFFGVYGSGYDVGQFIYFQF